MKTITNEKIKEVILLKDGRTNKEIANDLGVSSMRVSSNYSYLSNNGLVPKLSLIKDKTKKIKSKLDGVTSKYKQKMLLNTYSNSDGVNKQNARDKMEVAVLKSQLFEKPILTLPFKECKFEMQLLKNISSNLRFLGCEKDNDTYNNMLLTIAKNNLPISTHKGLIGEVINEARENQFGNLILDYCGQFASIFADIKTAMDNKIVCVKGTICITANKRIAGGTFDIYEQMEKLNPKSNLDEETRCVHTMKTFISRVGGFNYSIEEVFDYNDGRGKNMVLIIVRRLA